MAAFVTTSDAAGNEIVRCYVKGAAPAVMSRTTDALRGADPHGRLAGCAAHLRRTHPQPAARHYWPASQSSNIRARQRQHARHNRPRRSPAYALAFP